MATAGAHVQPDSGIAHEDLQGGEQRGQQDGSCMDHAMQQGCMDHPMQQGRTEHTMQQGCYMDHAMSPLMEWTQASQPCMQSCSGADTTQGQTEPQNNHLEEQHPAQHPMRSTGDLQAQIETTHANQEQRHPVQCSRRSTGDGPQAQQAAATLTSQADAQPSAQARGAQPSEQARGAQPSEQARGAQPSAQATDAHGAQATDAHGAQLPMQMPMTLEASMVYAMCKHAKTEAVFQRTLASRCRELGSTHPDTLAAANDLAAMFWRMGRWAPAAQVLQQVLALQHQTLGGDHPSSVQTSRYLTECVQRLERHRQLQPLLHRAVQETLREGGEQQAPLIADNLALYLSSAGLHSDAERVHRRTAGHRWHWLGPEHPSTLLALNNLAMCLVAMGKHAEAEPMLRFTLAACQRVLGPSSPDTRAVLRNLCGCMLATGQHDKARALLHAWKESGGQATAGSSSSMQGPACQQARELGFGQNVGGGQGAAVGYSAEECGMGGQGPGSAVGCSAQALGLGAQGSSAVDLLLLASSLLET